MLIKGVNRTDKHVVLAPDQEQAARCPQRQSVRPIDPIGKALAATDGPVPQTAPTGKGSLLSDSQGCPRAESQHAPAGARSAFRFQWPAFVFQQLHQAARHAPAALPKWGPIDRTIKCAAAAGARAAMFWAKITPVTGSRHQLRDGFLPAEARGPRSGSDAPGRSARFDGLPAPINSLLSSAPVPARPSSGDNVRGSGFHPRQW